MYIFAHISYEDLPVTWSQLYTTLVVLISEWHKPELSKNLATDSLLTKFKNRLMNKSGKINKDNSVQSQFKNTLLENGKKVIEDSKDLIAAVGKLLIDDAEDCDHELPDHNSAVPYLEHFLSSLETFLNSDHKELDKALKDMDAFLYFWNKRNALEIIRSEHGTAKQQADLPSLTAEVSKTVVTSCDIHSLLYCLPYMHDPHTVVLDKCFIGTQAAREFSRFLVADSWTAGIKHLQ